MPVKWSKSQGTYSKSPGSPAQASLPIWRLPPKRRPTVYLAALPEGSLPFRLSVPGKAKATRCSAALLGSTTLAFRFVLPPEGFRTASR